MKSKPVSQLSPELLERLIASLAFYKQVREMDGQQYQLLLQNSQIITFELGEKVLSEGDIDSWLYFLLKGQLVVLAGEGRQVVNQVTPGEVFGDLALLTGGRRSATIEVDQGCAEAMVFATDFSVFGPLEDLSRIHLGTKLAYYRNLLLSLRWKLEVYRGQYPASELADLHRRVKLYSGAKNTKEELLALHDQACQLAGLLGRWNHAFGRLSQVQTEAPNEKLLQALVP